VGELTERWKTKLLILSACDTASFLDNSFRESVVGDVIRLGYPSCVIAYQNEMSQSAALEFVTEFVKALGKQEWQLCVRDARREIRRLAQRPDAGLQRAARDWWLPVNYAATQNPDIVPTTAERVAAAKLGPLIRGEGAPPARGRLSSSIIAGIGRMPRPTAPRSARRSQAILETEASDVTIE
jgi:hypothetical protein